MIFSQLQYSREDDINLQLGKIYSRYYWLHTKPRPDCLFEGDVLDFKNEVSKLIKMKHSCKLTTGTDVSHFDKLIEKKLGYELEGDRCGIRSMKDLVKEVDELKALVEYEKSQRIRETNMSTID